MSATPLADTRTAAQAGRFYDADPADLRRAVELALAGEAADPAEPPPLALLAPHAGYVYSGAVAGAAYRAVAGRRIERVLLLGPSHRVELRGAALSPHRAWQTPLGEIPLDEAAAAELLDAGAAAIDPAAHAAEHSLEVQLPFLQVALAGPFQILPLLVGAPPGDSFELLARALAPPLERWRREDRPALIVASSDAYHGEDGNGCDENNARLAALIDSFDPPALEAAFRGRELMACGWQALLTALALARIMGAGRARTLAAADSRAASGRREGYVVGYLAARLDLAAAHPGKCL